MLKNLNSYSYELEKLLVGELQLITYVALVLPHIHACLNLQRYRHIHLKYRSNPVFVCNTYPRSHTKNTLLVSDYIVPNNLSPGSEGTLNINQIIIKYTNYALYYISRLYDTNKQHLLVFEKLQDEEHQSQLS